MPYTYSTAIHKRLHNPTFEWVDAPEKYFLKVDQAFYRGDWIDPTDLPTTARMMVPDRSIPDMFSGITYPFLSMQVKDLIEELEPDVHQFIPIILLKKNRDILREDYFWFHMRQRLDTMIPEKSDIEWRVPANARTERWVETKPPSTAVFTLDRKLIEGKHMWREQKMGFGTNYCSGEFRDEFKKRGFKYLEFEEIRSE